MSTSRGLRAWQRMALDRYRQQRPRDFLVVATPGAGKTTFALQAAGGLFLDSAIDQIVVVTPTEHLKRQWAEAAEQIGIPIDPDFSNTVGQTSADYLGVAVTYAQVARAPQLYNAALRSRRTLVILDETHHAGDNLSWGDGVRDAFAAATHRLALSGTPFRSDQNPIAFLTYEEDGTGARRSVADFSYGYSDALAEGVVRPVMFFAYSGNARWVSEDGQELSARLNDPMTKDLTARAWRTALDPVGQWIPAVFEAANRRLDEVRADGMPDAGGLVLASNIKHAEAYARVLKDLTGEQPTLIVSEDTESSAKIAEFSASTDRWAVAVRQVSEGVDIPRLAVGVYATNVSAPLFFAQAIGRFVRARRPGETASVFLPAVPSLMRLASELEQQRDHVLGGRSDEAEEGLLDDSLLERANRLETEAGPAAKFEALDADAQLDRAIYNGAEFGPEAGPDSQAAGTFVSLPGLVSADEIAAMLAARVTQLNVSAGTGAAGAVTAVPLHVRVRDARRELHDLVGAFVHRSGKSHAAIHSMLRNQTRGPSASAAPLADLEQRIRILESWF